ncbi:PilZ domain-containing protein [Acetivibrio cellulolyticus]|uniref:PilZ domain-containing protein n=1 Tax=Acetivibrio cellulolyticus TaxID=35830 RepID=UPI0001E2FB17|nr:PilZ domain-containing protein [Acetivibrio cellulolyticus]
MELKPGDIVSVAHYSEDTSFQSIVLDVVENEVLLNLPKKFSIYNLFENDPVVLGFRAGLEIYAAECSIRIINVKDSSIALKVDNIEFVKEKRIFERFPVSLYADIRTHEDGNRKIACISNISLDGLAMVSRNEFFEEDTIDFDIYIDKRILRLSGSVIWKEKISGNFQYGIKIIYQDFNTKNSLKLYMNILKNEQEKAIMLLKE